MLIDATVPLATAVGGRPTRVLGVWQGSAAEQAQRSSARTSRWQRAFHSLSATVLEGDQPVDCDVIVCSDDDRARQVASRAGEQNSRGARHRRRQAGERAHRRGHDRAADHAEHPPQGARGGMAGDGAGNLRLVVSSSFQVDPSSALQHSSKSTGTLNPRSSGAFPGETPALWDNGNWQLETALRRDLPDHAVVISTATGGRAVEIALRVEDHAVVRVTPIRAGKQSRAARCTSNRRWRA